MARFSWKKKGESFYVGGYLEVGNDLKSNELIITLIF